MVLFPFVEGDLGSFVFTLLFSIILTVSDHRAIRTGGTILMAIAVGSRQTYYLLGGGILDQLSYLFGTILLSLVSFLLFLSLFKTRGATSDIIGKAISAYLLLGLAWACLFALMESFAPSTFKDSIDPDVAMNFSTLVHYNFVTMATLGYGDILPTTQVARGLVIVEVLMGVLYMAILISRLVGTWKPSRDDSNR